jgi:hypothetical protein
MKFIVGNNVIDRFKPIQLTGKNGLSNTGNGDCIDYLYFKSNENTITLSLTSNLSWFSRYNHWLTFLYNIIYNSKKTYLRTINNTAGVDGDFILIPGRCINFNYKPVANEILISRDILKYKKPLNDILHDLSLCQMCIYHFTNSLVHRYMNIDKPYGTLLRYLSAQAYWNLYAYSRGPLVDVVSTLDSIHISLGYVSEYCKASNIDFIVDIQASGRNLGLFGIFVTDVGASDQDNVKYNIYRNFHTNYGIDWPLKDITNPADCYWQYGGTWSRARIMTTFLDVIKNKMLFKIKRNPFVTGSLRSTSDYVCTFNIVVTCIKRSDNTPIDYYDNVYNDPTITGDQITPHEGDIIRTFTYNLTCNTYVSTMNPEIAEESGDVMTV